MGSECRECIDAPGGGTTFLHQLETIKEHYGNIDRLEMTHRWVQRDIDEGRVEKATLGEWGRRSLMMDGALDIFDLPSASGLGQGVACSKQEPVTSYSDAPSSSCSSSPESVYSTPVSSASSYATVSEGGDFQSVSEAVKEPEPSREEIDRAFDKVFDRVFDNITPPVNPIEDADMCTVGLEGDSPDI